MSIVDYRVGNISSLVYSFQKVGAKCEVISTPQEILRAHALVLPGVGGFALAARQLKHFGLFEALYEAHERYRLPVLGVCLGMHLLGDMSEEGDGQGLGLIRGVTSKIRPYCDRILRIPHLGWNSLRVPDSGQPWLHGISRYDEFYFCHSYHFTPRDRSTIAAYTNYGEEFASIVIYENVVGVQFHPEKSGLSGKTFLTKFLGGI